VRERPSTPMIMNTRNENFATVEGPRVNKLKVFDYNPANVSNVLFSIDPVHDS
jgi:hypothetical protein